MACAAASTLAVLSTIASVREEVLERSSLVLEISEEDGDLWSRRICAGSDSEGTDLVTIPNVSLSRALVSKDFRRVSIFKVVCST